MEQSYRFPHRQLLGWIWLGLGLIATSFVGVSFASIFREPGGGFDLLPAFLLFVFLPFSLLCLLTGYTLLANKSGARPLTVVLSSILAVFSGLFLVLGRTLVVFRYVPLPLLLALGIYGIVVALRVQFLPHDRTQASR